MEPSSSTSDSGDTGRGRMTSAPDLSALAPTSAPTPSSTTGTFPRRRSPLTNPQIRPLAPVTVATLETPLPRRPSPSTPLPMMALSSMPVVTMSTSSSPPVGVPADGALSTVQSWLAEAPPSPDNSGSWAPPDVTLEVEETLRRALQLVGGDPSSLELLSLIHIPSPRDRTRSRMPSSA